MEATGMSHIRTKPATDQYREGWDRVFGKPKRLHRSPTGVPDSIPNVFDEECPEYAWMSISCCRESGCILADGHLGDHQITTVRI